MGIMSDLARGADMDTAVDREMLRYAVQRAITCVASGAVLDMRSAVLMTAKRGDVTITSMVVTGAVWDARKMDMHALSEANGLTLEIIDGRKLA